ncbi:MAG: hypothetical protein JST54_31390 [Deltaproteobacteria bacterium]|nr:hypothetical protein [Deltaproteobacteria bacterium]
MHAGACSCWQKVGKVSSVPVVPELPDEELELLELDVVPEPLDDALEELLVPEEDDELELVPLLDDEVLLDELLELDAVALLLAVVVVVVVPPPSLGPLPPKEQPAAISARQTGINERQRMWAPKESAVLQRPF